MAQTLGVVHIFASRHAAEDGLRHQADQRMAAVLPGAYIGECLARHDAQVERVVEFSVGRRATK
jgi:hypothetical protein